MAQTEAKPPGAAEAEGYVFVTFRNERQHGSFTKFEADCLLASDISGLKEDFRRELGDPATQRWFYGSLKLSDNKRLFDYGIDGCNDITIVVKKENQ